MSMIDNVGVHPRAAAVRRLVTALADRTDFVVLVPPGLEVTVAERLALLPDGWSAWLDSGTGRILELRSAAAIGPLALISGAVVVLTVPKTTPAAVLGDVLGQELPADGSRDLLVIQDDDAGPVMVWPLLFVDALDQVDPAAAAQIRASTTVVSP